MFSGYGGLDRATAGVLGDVELRWVADPYGPARRVLAANYPGVPNLGDVTGVRWREQDPVDVLAAGFPCQDVSLAGRRAGLHPDQSGMLFEQPSMWWQTCRALDELEPALIVIENVGGLLSAPADAVGQPGRGSAFGAVLADLADRGFDVEWSCATASAVGAPHRRRRVFVVAAHLARLGRRPRADGLRPGGATEAGNRRPVAVGGRDGPDADPDGAGREGPEPAGGRELPTWRGGAAPDALGDVLRDVLADRLGRPGEGPAVAGDDGAGRAATDPDGRGLPQLEELDPERRGRHEAGAHGDDALGCGVVRGATGALDWGGYSGAVRRWERVLGRPAPAPAVLGDRGGRVLSAEFVEWLMGLPAGWVTAVPGITRKDMLRLLGNGVVPQQAGAAVAHLLGLTLDERAAA